VFAGKTYWIVGASEGLGRALAQALDAEGAALVLSARNGARLEELAATLSNARALPCDVTDPASVAAAFGALGPCDGVVYCAGAYDPMDAADWDAKAVDQMTAVNYQGAVHVLGHIAPAFAARGAGHIVLIGSLGGFRGLPQAVGYSASKAALMVLGESLHADLSPRGVRVQISNPGFIATRLTEKNAFKMAQIMSPETAAAHVVKAMKSKRLHSSFPKPFSLAFTIGRSLPIGIFYRIMGVKPAR